MIPLGKLYSSKITKEISHKEYSEKLLIVKTEDNLFLINIKIMSKVHFMPNLLLYLEKIEQNNEINQG